MALPTFSSDKFNWSKLKQTGTTFASDLGLRASDAWPEQFYIKSEKTGQSKLFLPGSPIFNGRGEDQEFVGATFFVPGGNIEITIYND
jgi:hypothetical protein